MKKDNFTLLKTLTLLCAMLVLVFVSSCDEDSGDPKVEDKEVTATFSYTASGSTITFVNASANAVTYTWDFGDGETSADANPVHEYDVPGTYTVVLTGSNDTFNDEFTLEVITENGGPLAKGIIGKEWIAARGAVYAYAQGADKATDGSWTDRTPQNFGWGDVEGSWSLLLNRPSLANDVYMFNVDNTMSVDFKGDFWAEYSMWSSEGAFDITTIPANADGVDMSAFGNPNDDWTFVIDEVSSKIICKGQGAHILNPRLAYSAESPNPVLTPQAQVSYDIVRVVEVAGAADTLVIYADIPGLGLGHYITLHAYEKASDIPGFRPLPVLGQNSSSVLSSGISHTFLSAEGAGASVGSVDGPYDVTYGTSKAGETCTEFIRDNTGSDQYANYLMRTDHAEIDFSSGTTVKVDVYFPSTNDYTGSLTKKVFIRFIDESRLAGNFWQEYIQIESADVPLDTWTTLTFDFADALAAGASAEVVNSPDGVMIEFGGSGHFAAGTFYAKNWLIE